MLKNPNSSRASARPRPTSSRSRCASNLCAAIAAVLLLLSVSVLYNRLSYESTPSNKSQVSNFSSFRLGFPSFVSTSNDPKIRNVDQSEQDRRDDTDTVIDPDQHEVDDEKEGVEDRIDSGLDPQFENEGFGELGDDVEDRIDEFDFFEEDYQVDSEGGADENSNSSDSKGSEENDEVSGELGLERKGRVGYFWDHVMGVTRRDFARRGIGFNGLGDDGDFLNLDEEDRSKIAFSSDDQPVDEGVRSRLQEVKRIEDALLVKTGGGGGGGLSKLRDGWAPWFDNVQKRSSKGDFFRRDRMFRSNLDMLNPVNNPLLQDPDGAGVTVFTRGDRLVQKVLRSELEKTPFGGQKVLGSGEVGGNEGNVEESGSGVKGMERRTLDAAAKSNLDLKNRVKGFDSFGLTRKRKMGLDDHGKKQSKRERFPSKNNLRDNSQLLGSPGKDKAEGADSRLEGQGIKRGIDSPMDQKQLSSRAGNKIRMKHHYRDDSQRWGYFPGLDRHLQFSEFMDRFFRYGECSLQVFMVWNSPPWAYTVRYQRSLESFLYHHPVACVVVFSETIELEFFNDFVKDGYDLKTLLMLLSSDEWWRNFGIDDLELQTLAIRILSQTCSSSGCERNWSVFERIHTKRRNRLEHKRLNDLVYTHYNLRLKESYKIAVVIPNLDELLKDTPTHIFASVWLEWRKTHHYPIHSSELVRLAALYKYGGIYLDSDIIVLNPLSSLNNSIGMEGQPGGKPILNGAVMAFQRNSAFIMECLREFYSTYDDTSLRWNGADLLARTFARLSRKEIDVHKQLDLKIEPPIAFFPISSQSITRYFLAPADETERGLQESLFRRILDDSLTVHFWNSLTSALVPEPGSLVEKLINHRCLRCLDVL